MGAVSHSWPRLRVRARLRARTRARARLRRALFFCLTFVTAGAASTLLLRVLEANRASALEIAGLVLFFILFAWISASTWTAIAGFAVRLFGGDPAGLSIDEVAGRALHTRTAVVMPIYNEDPRSVAAGLEAIWSSLAREPEHAAFDLFILSDSTAEDIAAEEQALWRALVARYHGEGRIFYRRRHERIGHKAGNIADFVRRYGAAYECMVVLDADSIMSGSALVTLARLMEAHPEIGIIQTVSLCVRRQTLFGRFIQFGARLQSPMLSSGLAFWQLGESNYFGHNAIVRVRPFARHCELPRLPGKPPLGGEILSHDFVEAAFMRRAGFEVRMLPELEGSFEQVPANVIDFAARDRRWTQGNLQHARLLGTRGLHPLSRVHLASGILCYLTSPMWLALLVLSSVVSAIESAKVPRYFVPGVRSPFPLWPHPRSWEILLLLGITVLMLSLPKLLGLVLAIRDRSLRRGFGGAGRLCAGLLCEQLLSMLLAPSMMLFHTSFVIQTLLGRVVRWSGQDRSDRGVGVREALSRQWYHLLVGLVWGALMLRYAPRFFWWLTPVLAGLILSVALTAWTSRRSAGALARRAGLLLIPEETAPPPELASLG